ncbi:MAG: hypothetical protein P4L54_09860 [Acidocella sp.]|nr:hypothetical protein [Acidocella sp.]
MPIRFPPAQAGAWLLGLVVAVVPLAAFGTLVLRHFYVLGAFWSDSGAIAAVMWHSGPLLRLPLVNGSASFFQYHITLVFLLLSLVSWLTPLSEVWYFALISGLAFMLPAIAVYWLLVAEYRMNRGLTLLAAASVSILFAFNGITLAVSRNPHFEMLIVGTGLMFLTGLLRKRYDIATLFFLLCLATREDAGFHLALLLGVFSILCKLNGVDWRQLRPVIIFGGSGMLYGLLAFAVQKLCFPGYDALHNVYLGSQTSPQHGWRMIIKLLEFYALDRGFIFLPAYLTLVWAFRARNIMIVAGFIACLPWALLSLFAASPWAATLSGYYCFPFIFALFWPLFGPRLAAQYGCTFKPVKRPVAIFSLLLLTSFIQIPAQYNPGHITLPESFYQLPSWQEQQKTEASLHELVLQRARLGQLKIDSGVAALDPGDYTNAQLIESPGSPPPDSIIYFAGGYQLHLVTTAAQMARLRFHYKIPGTSLRVISDRPLGGLADMIPVQD